MVIQLDRAVCGVSQDGHAPGVLDNPHPRITRLRIGDYIDLDGCIPSGLDPPPMRGPKDRVSR